MKKAIVMMVAIILLSMIPVSGENVKRSSYSPWFRDITIEECTIIFKNITANSTWNEDGSPYYVVNQIYVKNSSVLTIKKGAVVIFSPDARIEMENSSLLKAWGQPTANTIFFSIAESNQCFVGNYNFMRCEFWNMGTFNLSNSESEIYHCNFYGCDGIILGDGKIIWHSIFVENQNPVRMLSGEILNSAYVNSFIDCTYTEPLGNGIWDDTSNISNGRGNYWSDYNGVDNDDDGIGDTNLPCHGVDWLPLMESTSDDYRSNWAEWDLTPRGDNDFDGMSDDWEVSTNCSETMDDTDDDGLTNIEEYVGGTNPNVYDGPIPPQADFTYSPETPYEGEVVWFNDASVDGNGTIVTWSWDLGDGNWSSERNPKHSYLIPDIYIVSLTVIDNIGLDDKFEMAIAIKEIIPPTANFTYGPEIPYEGEVVRFEDASLDGNGTIMSWLWDLGNGNQSTNRNPTYSYWIPGEYLVTLTVTDNRGSTNNISILINIEESIEVEIGSHISSHVEIIANKTSGVAPLNISFIGEMYNSNEFWWEWDFGDGNISDRNNMSYIFEKPGRYVVTLTMMDDNNSVKYHSVIITVRKIGKLRRL